MSKKTKLRNAKNTIVNLYKEHPAEMLVATAAVISAAAKLANTVTESRNAETWRREVKRRESKTQD